jgi:rRNA maturation RNase YbeY
MPSTPSATVKFFFQDTSIRLDRRKALKTFISTVFKKEGKQLDSLNIIFCTDPILLQINREFLDHDFYTDIITFDLSDSGAIRAEIYISADRVRENAQTLSVSIEQELHRVIFHGILHLCGFKDKSSADKALMRKKENHYLRQYL